jgi:sulfur-oxidizing protein SoxX
MREGSDALRPALGMAASLMAITLSACLDKSEGPRRLAGADPARGRAAIEKAACGACHDIPGVDWPQGRVGGSLKGFATRPLIAGRFPNQPGVLVLWLRNAPALAPGTAMPPQALTVRQARDVAAYLYTLE